MEGVFTGEKAAAERDFQPIEILEFFEAAVGEQLGNEAGLIDQGVRCFVFAAGKWRCRLALCRQLIKEREAILPECQVIRQWDFSRFA